MKNKLAKLKYLPNKFNIIEEGDHVICAVSGKKIPLENLPVVGFGCVEEWCRLNGLGVIHGGKNALRFTPHFNITHKEIHLIYSILNKVFKKL